MSTSAPLGADCPAGCALPLLHAAPAVTPTTDFGIIPNPAWYGHAAAPAYTSSEGVKSYIWSVFAFDTVNVTCWKARLYDMLARTLDATAHGWVLPAVAQVVIIAE